MPSSVQFENTYPEDERWLDAGADAFALHFAACCYTDRHNKDGVVPKAMVSRIALAVPPERVPAAVDALLMAGFWKETKAAYVVVNFIEDKIGIPAEEKISNRNRWAADKRWRRRHNAGNHDECPPEKCRQSGVVSHSDNRGTLTRSPAGVQEDSYRTTRPDSIRPDSTRPDLRSREGELERGRPSGPASAGAPAYPPAAEKHVGGLGGDTPPPGFTAERWERYTAALAGIDAAIAADGADGADGLEGLVSAGGAD